MTAADVLYTRLKDIVTILVNDKKNTYTTLQYGFRDSISQYCIAVAIPKRAKF